MSYSGAMDDDDGRVRWFGPTWYASICEEGYHVDTPVGQQCLFCPALILDGEQGVTMLSGDGRRPAHIVCLLRNVGQAHMSSMNPFIAPLHDTSASDDD